MIDNIRNEIENPHALAIKNLGKTFRYFAYPYGDSSDEAVTFLKNKGYQYALTVQSGGNPTFADPMRLRRAMILRRGHYILIQTKT